MTTYKENQQYYQLKIHGSSSDVEIWIGDNKGHPVQKAIGMLNTSLLAGKYTVEFGLGTQCYPINLSQNLQLTQSEIEAGPTCERPKINIDK
ncbi:hypothetical protein ACG2F4_16455 [Halalkalibaculum sp. DA3122]